MEKRGRDRANPPGTQPQTFTHAQGTAAERAGRIYSAIRSAAESDLPAPSNAALAERFSVTNGTVRLSLNFLVANGMIEVRRAGRERVITICATGRQTARQEGTST